MQQKTVWSLGALDSGNTFEPQMFIKITHRHCHKMDVVCHTMYKSNCPRQKEVRKLGGSHGIWLKVR